MSLSLRSVLPDHLPLPGLHVNVPPGCANPLCPRPATFWQRWWARNEGIRLAQEWVCSPECFRSVLPEHLKQYLYPAAPREARPNRIPLGLVLLSQGTITADQLKAALAAQGSAGTGRIGEWLILQGAATEQDILRALAIQQGCPTFSASEQQALPAALHFPLSFVESYRATPVFFSQPQNTLYVGFRDTVLHAFLLALEQMFGCNTRPCIIAPALFESIRCRTKEGYEGETISIEQHQTSRDMSEMITDYARQTNAKYCGVIRCGDRLWTRLSDRSGYFVDLLFRVTASAIS